MKGACAAALLLVSTAASAQDADRDAGRWVCVPSNESGWRCGRGANAPEPAPLPPREPPASPPAGYEPPQQDSSGVPAYLLDPTLPAPADEATADSRPGDSPGEEPDASGSVTPEAERPAPAEEAAAADSVTDPMPESTEVNGGRSADTDGAPGSTGQDAGSGAEAMPADSAVNARYSIQLTAARDRDSLAAYREQLTGAGVDVFHRTWEDAGGTWHVLLTGRFQTVAAARRALEALPDDVRGSGAWIRPLASLEP